MLTNWFVVFPLLCALSLVAATCQDTCQSGPNEGQWLSSIRLSNVGPETITFTWDADPIFDPDVYVVKYRERNEEFFTFSSELGSALTYVVENLEPSTLYEGQVCRASLRSLSDDCGGCLICFQTTEAQEPPGVPQRVLITANGPETLTLSWDQPEIVNGRIDEYDVQCNVSGSGETIFERNILTSSVPPNTGIFDYVVVIPFEFLTSNTSYVCEVTATNSFGTSLPAVVQVATPPRTKIPGNLLLVYSNSVIHAKLTEDSLFSNVLTMSNSGTLLSNSATFLGIDYHFYRNEIYMMTSNSLTRIQVQLSQDFVLSLVSGPEVVLTFSSAISEGAIAVDWIYDEIYWIERVQGQAGSTIRRAIINDNGTVNGAHCVAQFTNTEVLHIVVDPVRGYFYWSDTNGIYRVELNSVRVSQSSCPSRIPSNMTVIANQFLQSFTVGSDGRIYFIGYSDCFLDRNTNQSVLSTDSNGETIFPHFAVGSVGTMDSFSQAVFIPSIPGNNFLISVDTSEAASCPDTVDTFFGSSTPEMVQIIRIYQSVKQPLPVPPTPPTGVRVITTSTTAIVTWDAPLFVGNLYSSSAYSSWMYILSYHNVLTPLSEQSQNTTLLTLTLENLQPGTVYELKVSAVGPGGQQDIPQQLVFSTKASESDSSLLLVATEDGVFQSSLGGNQPVLIGGILSSESNGVTYDTYNEEYFWAIQGGQGSIYTSNSTLSRRLIDFRDNPFELKYDWVARRLFWVEDGSTSRGPKRIMLFNLEEQDEGPRMFAEASNIQAMALDSINGILFWTESNTIQMKTLSGLDLPMCYEASEAPSALAVDVDRRRLYWLSLVSNSEVLSVHQLEYSTLECMESITTQEIPELTFSSSPTALTYAADTLFIGSLSSNEVYSVAADLAAVDNSSTLAFGSIQSSTTIRDIFIVTRSVQPLPGSLQPSFRQADALTPSVTAPIPQLGDGSTRFSIEITWNAVSPLDVAGNSPVLYQLSYSIQLNGADTADPFRTINTTSTSYKVMRQQPLTLATVNASITVLSLWYRGTSSPLTVFESLPDLPGRVTNLRAYTYQPTLNENELTALVVWDEPDFVVTTYGVRMFDLNGMELYNPDVEDAICASGMTLVVYQPVNETRTQYSILLRRCDTNDVMYPGPGTYEVEITPFNPSGQGNSSRVTVNITAPDYPQQIIGLVDNGIQSSGEGITFSASPASNIPGHFAVDTIGRMVYWFHSDTHIICRRSLDGGVIDYFILLPQDSELLAMSFEWVAMELYYIVAEGTSRTIAVYKVPAVNRDALTRVLPNLQDTVMQGTQVQMAVDPFKGYLYYLAADSTSSLHVLDLRQGSAITSNVLSGSRSRRQASGNSLSELSLAPALALEPRTGDLLVSDVASGNILGCSVNCSEGSCASNCALLVDHAQLLGGNIEIGLPATSIALNEQRIYWTSISSDRIFAVDRSNLIALINFEAMNASAILTLSPGQQPLPANEMCLSPQQLSGDVGNRLKVIGGAAVNRTNTTLLVTWNVPRLERCEDVVFSYPALTYGVELLRLQSTVPGYPMYTVDNEYLIENLEPFTEYMVEIKGCNRYTRKSHVRDSLFGLAVRLMTLEGVPDQPQALQSTVFGTSNVNLTWNRGANLRGLIAMYYVQLPMNEVQTNDTSITLMKEDGVLPGVRQTIGVIVSNGVLNSSVTFIEVTPWPLAPMPIMSAVTNTSLNVSVQLTQPGINYDPIVEIEVQLCSLPNGSVDCSTCSSQGMISRSTQQVNELTTLEYHFNQLVAFSDYCIRSVGTYTVAEGIDMPEVTAGDYTILRTQAGRPDAPEIEIDEVNRELLTWNTPNSRGRPITTYLVYAMRTDAPSAEEIVIPISATSINLQQQTRLEINEAYDIQVVARNDIGDSDRSRTETFTRLIGSITTSSPSPSSLPVATIAGIAVGGSLLLLIVFVVITIIACYCCCGRSEKRDLKSLSYMYGPDHELSNLRHAYRHAQANNPHYTWSMEDYVCTDEDLEILNKFPRQNLKLETFIDRGEFGEVFQGTAVDILGESTGPTPVAVKTLRKGTTLEEQRKFLSEASLMSHFNHPNILKVLGVCVDNDPVYIILELMPAGDLLKFLRDAKRDHGPTLLTLAEQIQVALDVAHGCRYLEQQHFIHRDIAARNCLVSSRGADRVVKIGDFGLAKDLYSSDYYQVEGQRKLPVRWMAPEALLQGKFTIESDIWSYGVLLWEIMTLGNQPYPGRINQEVLQYVTGGGRLDRPEKCPGRIYHLMQNCWKRYSSERPHFEKIVEVLTTFLDRLKRPDSVYYSDSDSDEGGDNLNRQSSVKTPTRTPSIRSGIMNLARTGSMKLRNSFRRHGSVHRRDDHAVSQISVSSSENLIASEEGNAFRERGPF